MKDMQWEPVLAHALPGWPNFGQISWNEPAAQRYGGQTEFHQYESTVAERGYCYTQTTNIHIPRSQDPDRGYHERQSEYRSETPPGYSPTTPLPLRPNPYKLLKQTKKKFPEAPAPNCGIQNWKMSGRTNVVFLLGTVQAFHFVTWWYFICHHMSHFIAILCWWQQILVTVNYKMTHKERSEFRSDEFKKIHNLSWSNVHGEHMIS